MKNRLKDIIDYFDSISVKHKIFQIDIKSYSRFHTLRQVRYINNNLFKGNRNYKLTTKNIQSFKMGNILGLPSLQSIKKTTDYYSDEIEKFKETLESNFEPEDLRLLHKNINSILIKKTKIHKHVSGGYYGGLNIIIMEKERALHHELFHMASSYTDEDLSISGFDYKDDFYKFGKAINEGYTELMTNRYFNDDISSSGYKDQIEVCKQIEEIIGQDKMQKFYMQGKPTELLLELAKYSSRDEAKEFIKKNDLLLYTYESNVMKKNVSEKDKDKYKQLKTEIQSFLRKLKVAANCNDNEITHTDDINFKI